MHDIFYSQALFIGINSICQKQLGSSSFWGIWVVLNELADYFLQKICTFDKKNNEL
jgi:hypothetical protein